MRGAILPHYFTSHAWAELYPHVSGNYYRPLFLLWFRLNHAMFGLDPKGWHLTTILCHVAATYMVLVLVRRLAASPWIAFSAATLFALHPVHIESVAWVSGVTDPLMAIFLIGSFLAYLRFREGNRCGLDGFGTHVIRAGTARKRDDRCSGSSGFRVRVALRGGAFLDFTLRHRSEAIPGFFCFDNPLYCLTRLYTAWLVAFRDSRDLAHHGAYGA